MRLAVVGKGGAGKSMTAGTLARILARDGHRVLALDSDLLPGLELSLGVKPPPTPPLVDAAFRDEKGRWRFRPGVGPVRAVQRYALHAPDGVLLLQCGKTPPEGLPAIMPAVQAFYRVIHRIGDTATFRDWTLLGDLPAGPRQVAFGWVPYASRLLLIVEPTMQSMLAARRVARIGSQREAVVITPVANKVRSADDVRRIERFLGVRMSAVLPLDPAVAAAERAGVALIDHAPESPTVEALRGLARWLDAGTVGRA